RDALPIARRGDRHRRPPRLLARRGHLDRVLAGIHGYGELPGSASDGNSVAANCDAWSSRCFVADTNREPRQRRLERADPLPREIDSIAPPLASRARGCLAELGPGGRRFPLRLVARREGEQRSRRGVEALALGELRARLVVTLGSEQGLALLEERFRKRCIGR